MSERKVAENGSVILVRKKGMTLRVKPLTFVSTLRPQETKRSMWHSAMNEYRTSTF